MNTLVNAELITTGGSLFLAGNVLLLIGSLLYDEEKANIFKIVSTCLFIIASALLITGVAVVNMK